MTYCMKAIFICIIVLAVFSAIGQEIQINPFANYFMAGRLNGYEADALFENGPDFGLGLSYGLGNGKNIEVSYTIAASSAALRRNDIGTISEETKMTFGYIQAGYVQDFMLKQPKADIRPFLLGTIGAAYLNPEDASYTTVWRFAAAFGGGLKYFITERVGLRVQARLLLPLFFEGGGFYCGSGGCGAGVSTFTPLAQGDVGGGLVIKLGDDK